MQLRKRYKSLKKYYCFTEVIKHLTASVSRVRMKMDQDALPEKGSSAATVLVLLAYMPAHEHNL